MRVLVSENGNALNVQVLRRSQKDPAFERAALEAVKQGILHARNETRQARGLLAQPRRAVHAEIGSR